MKLRYKIFYDYDYTLNAVVITLGSKWQEKEYTCQNLQNMAAVLGHALIDFNELHKDEIEELENYDKIQEAQKRLKEKKPSRPELKPQ